MNRNVLKSFEIAPGVLGNPSYVQFGQTCWDGGFTGPTIVHWLHGRPQMVDFQREGVRLTLQTVKPKQRKERKSNIPQAPAPWNRI